MSDDRSSSLSTDEQRDEYTTVPRKRRCREGSDKNFKCQVCSRTYSRVDHLKRHQLNHDPSQVSYCDVLGCGFRYVRPDLKARHAKKHSRVLAEPVADHVSMSAPPADSISPDDGASLAGPTDVLPDQPHDCGLMLVPASHPLQGAGRPGRLPSSLHIPAIGHGWTEPAGMAGQSTLLLSPGSVDNLVRIELDEMFTPVSPLHPLMPSQQLEAFANWLFHPEMSLDHLHFDHMPALGGVLETAFHSHAQYEDALSAHLAQSRAEVHHGWSVISSPGVSPCHRLLHRLHPQLKTTDHVAVGRTRLDEVMQWIDTFGQRFPRYGDRLPRVFDGGPFDLQAIAADDKILMFLTAFWGHVAPRLPIVHRPTFSCDKSDIFLLMAMIALGAASLCSMKVDMHAAEHGAMADVIVIGLRWELMQRASQPVELAVVQALLLVELYEKLYSCREFHERAHVYHNTTLTLLRRGSPLFGRSGGGPPPPPPADSRIDSSVIDWWTGWVSTESMQRVVYAAFMMDTLHAAMFSHTANMSPHEIDLPLPCADALWNAPDSNSAQAHYEATVGSVVRFLDGLKLAFNCQTVATHPFGRVIILSGLISLGWHLRCRETDLHWLDLGADPHSHLQRYQYQQQQAWRQALFGALDAWKISYQDDDSERARHADVFYHLAYISLNVNLIQCLVYSRTHHRVERRELSCYTCQNADADLTAWSTLSSTREAVRYAFILLRKILFDEAGGPASYSVRQETDPHRLWIIYYASLSIWAFVHALGRHLGIPVVSAPALRLVDYLARVADRSELTECLAATLHDGLATLLATIQDILGEARQDLFREGRARLAVCSAILDDMEIA